MTRIFIEDNELDITADFSHQITYAVDDIVNFDSKSTSFTKTIVLSGTATNNRLFGNIFEFANSNFTNDIQPNVGYNFNASKSAKARIEIDGLQVMKGVMRLLEIIVDGNNFEYEIALFGELGGFVSKLGAKKLCGNSNGVDDLDFSQYNTNWNYSNIIASWSNAGAGSGIVYPLIDYGNVSYNIPSTNPTYFAKKDYQFSACRPAFFVREILDKIITNAGYTWESNFFNTAFFKRLIIPNNQKRLSKYTNFELNVATTGFNYTTSDGASKPIGFGILTAVGSFTPSVSNTIFTYSGANFTGQLNFRLKGSFIKSDSIPAVVKININGTPIISIGIAPYSATTYQPFDVNGGAFIQIQNGNVLTATIEKIGGGTWTLQFDTATTNLTINSGKLVQSPLDYNEFIYMNDILPRNILQKDFFASILKMFNLLVTEDKYIDRHLIIEPYVAFYDLDRTTYLDWSDNIDRSKPIRIKPMSENNSRYYEFKYKSDTDFYNDKYRKQYNEGYGDRIFDNQMEFVKDTSTTEVIFSATPLVGYTGKDKVLSTIFKLNNALEEQIESNIRILQTDLVDGVISWKMLNTDYNNVTSVLGTLTNYLYAGHLDNPDVPSLDLNFGATLELYFELVAGALSNNMFNTFYSSYLAEITDKDSRLVTCKMRLSNKDIFNLDFGRFIWCDGVLYRLIKISDYSDDDICEVQLLRVIYTTYELPNYDPLYIGKPYQGGIIAYLDNTNEHGFIASVNDIETSITWRNGGTNVLCGASGTAIGTGQANTNAIVSVLGAGTYGAKSCDNFTNDGYGDWYLPSKEEMETMYTNRALIGNFGTGNYWTSSEWATSPTSNAWYVPFVNGVSEPTGKGGLLRVRAIRTF